MWLFCATAHPPPETRLSPKENLRFLEAVNYCFSSFLHEGTWNHNPVWHPGVNGCGFCGQAWPDRAAPSLSSQQRAAETCSRAPCSRPTPGRLHSQASTRGPQPASNRARIHSDLRLCDTTAQHLTSIVRAETMERTAQTSALIIFTVLQRNFRQIIYFLSFMKSTKRSSHFIVPWTDRKCQRT